MKEQARAQARQLAHEFIQRGDATGWFEQLYTQAQGNEQAIHWADMEVNPNLAEWLDRRNIQGTGKLALVVGCGLGDDAEELASRGFEVVAFDIAPTAIAWCRKRFPQSPVEYVVADVFDPPPAWRGSFEFVLEAYTLQVLPADVRSRAMTGIAGLLAIDATLLVICRGRSPQGPPGVMFNEGYLVSGGEVPTRRDLAEDAAWLTALVARGLSGEPEPLGLLALMRLHLARAEARFTGAGELVLLTDQDRTLWDRSMIAEGIALIEQAAALGRPGPYQVEAAIVACHAEAESWAATDWRQIGYSHGTWWINPSTPCEPTSGRFWL